MIDPSKDPVQALKELSEVDVDALSVGGFIKYVSLFCISIAFLLFRCPAYRGVLALAEAIVFRLVTLADPYPWAEYEPP